MHGYIQLRIFPSSEAIRVKQERTMFSEGIQKIQHWSEVTEVWCAGGVADRPDGDAGVLHHDYGLHGVPGLPLQRREVLHRPPPQAAAARTPCEKRQIILYMEAIA
jgi:hypothetical protein